MIISQTANENSVQTSVQGPTPVHFKPHRQNLATVSKQHLSIQNSQPSHKRQCEGADAEVEEISVSGSEKKHGEKSARKKKRRDKTKDGRRYSSGVYLLPGIIG